MFLLLLFSCLVCSSVKTQKSWVNKINSASSDYVNQLYCGTAARGVTYLSKDKKPVDSKGFEEGLAKIIAVYASNPNHRPILNDVEVKWLRSQAIDIWKHPGFKAAWKGLGNIYKLNKQLFSMKRSSNRGISFASLLADAKDKRTLVREQEISQTVTFLNHVKNGASDHACLSLIEKLYESLTSRQISSAESGIGVINLFKNLQSGHIISEAVDEALSDVHGDPEKRLEIKVKITTAATEAARYWSEDKGPLKIVIRDAIEKILPPTKTIDTLDYVMEISSPGERNIIAAIIKGIKEFPEDVPNREITFISIYLYSHIQKYKQTESTEEKTTVRVAAEILVKYMEIIGRDSIKLKEAKRDARLFLRKILNDLSINAHMRLTEEEEDELLLIIQDHEKAETFFKKGNDVFWILQVIGLDFYNSSTPHPRVKELIAIMKDYESSLACAGPGITLVLDRLEQILKASRGSYAKSSN
jgi:hypothetical protein